MRIIAGKWRGRRLIAPEGEATRPTADRIKESMFSILGPLDSARVLDLYAGTGALGLEALSRGAEKAVLVESARPATKSIETNVATLGVGSQITLVAALVERSLSRVAGLGPYDVILVDPPYALLASAVTVIEKLAPSLAPGGRVVLEHSSKDEPMPEGLLRDSVRRYGSTSLSIFRRDAPEDEDEDEDVAEAEDPNEAGALAK